MVVVNYKIEFYIVSHIGLQSKQNQYAESIAVSIAISIETRKHINMEYIDIINLKPTYQYQ